MTRPPRRHEERVPREFFCPIGGTFMREPVIAPSSPQETCDLEALRTRRTNTNTFPVEGPDELLMPDLNLRSQMSTWLAKYKRWPTFAYISTHEDLRSAVASLFAQEPNDILEDSDLLYNLCELKLALEHKTQLIISMEGSNLMMELVEGCPVSPDNAAEWVKLSVGILAKAYHMDVFDRSDFVDLWAQRILDVIDRVCVDINDVYFEVGLINLLYNFQRNTNGYTEHVISSHVGVINALSSYILGVRTVFIHHHSFPRLFDIIIKLWVREDGLQHPKLSQAVASLVWPTPGRMNNTQYLYLLRTISSVLDSRPHDPDNHTHDYIEGSVEMMIRAGIVNRVFRLLHYATLEEAEQRIDHSGWYLQGRAVSEAEEAAMIMRCFEILFSLSWHSIGRLEMVRVIKRSAFRYLDAFCTAIERVISPDTLETHVIPAISVLCNLVENTRYTEMQREEAREESQGFDILLNMGFEYFDHDQLTGTVNELLATVTAIEIEDSISEDEAY